jgi:hypothetical protein
MSMFRRLLLSCVIALILASVPAHLAAEESRSFVADRSSPLGWLAERWNELAALFAGSVPAKPEPPPESTIDNGCAVDPHGGCGG